MYEITVTPGFVFRYLGIKTEKSPEEVEKFLDKDTILREMFLELLRQKTASLRELTELAEWFIVIAADPFYKGVSK